jgi:hypothetical protein
MLISTSDTMTSVNATSDVAKIDISSLALSNDVPGFLKSSAELRNQVYENAFTDTYMSNPVPHALTRVNRQIRSESRTMYYASIRGIKIWLRTPEQIKRAKTWLREEDMSLYPKMPTIELMCLGPRSSKDHSRLEVALCTKIMVVNPDKDFSECLRRLPPKDRFETANEHSSRCLEFTYLYCLGLPTQLTLRNPVPAEFVQAIEEPHNWLACQWRPVEADNFPIGAPRGFYDMISGLAAEMKGRRWRMSDLRTVVGWFGEREEEIEESWGVTACKNVLHPLNRS